MKSTWCLFVTSLLIVVCVHVESKMVDGVPWGQIPREFWPLFRIDGKGNGQGRWRQNKPDTLGGKNLFVERKKDEKFGRKPETPETNVEVPGTQVEVPETKIEAPQPAYLSDADLLARYYAWLAEKRYGKIFSRHG